MNLSCWGKSSIIMVSVGYDSKMTLVNARIPRLELCDDK